MEMKHIVLCVVAAMMTGVHVRAVEPETYGGDESLAKMVLGKDRKVLLCCAPSCGDKHAQH